MSDVVVGRLLVASLHQAVSDILPLRFEFYSAWLNPANLRAGRIGLAPLAAVLSFLRQEGEAYGAVTGRAGAYAAEWTFNGLSGFERRLLAWAPPRLRARLVTRLVRDIVESTCSVSRLRAEWRRGQGAAVITRSIFCEVREPVSLPLCEYYAAATRRLMQLFDLPFDVAIEHCRAMDTGVCRLALLAAAPGVGTPAPEAAE
jgi:hypothetical protein